MGLIDTINKDIQNITTNKNGFGVDINVTTPDGLTSVDVVGIHTKHHFGLNEDGQQVNTKNAHIAISEKTLLDAGYTVRGANEEVQMVDHKVIVKDSSGVDKNYIIRQCFPDETIGLIVFILGDFE